MNDPQCLRMADTVSREVRSRMMAGIRSRDTKPELILRRGLHALGFRFRIVDRTLPGRPDIVFPRYRAVIFAHGCFWHGHDCSLFRLPSTREDFWRTKIAGNAKRDADSEEQLLQLGWRVMTVWECAMRGPGRMQLDGLLAACALWIRSDSIRSHLRGSV